MLIQAVRPVQPVKPVAAAIMADARLVYESPVGDRYCANPDPCRLAAQMRLRRRLFGTRG